MPCVVSLRALTIDLAPHIEDGKLRCLVVREASGNGGRQTSGH